MMDTVNSVTKLTRTIMDIPWSHIVLFCLVSFLILATFIGTGIVPSESMSPTIKMNSRVWYKRILLPTNNSIRLGDAIVFLPTKGFYQHQLGDSETELLIKRVVGVPVSTILRNSIHICIGFTNIPTIYLLT